MFLNLFFMIAYDIGHSVGALRNCVIFSFRFSCRGKIGVIVRYCIHLLNFRFLLFQVSNHGQKRHRSLWSNAWRALGANLHSTTTRFSNVHIVRNREELLWARLFGTHRKLWCFIWRGSEQILMGISFCFFFLLLSGSSFGDSVQKALLVISNLLELFGLR